MFKKINLTKRIDNHINISGNSSNRNIIQNKNYMINSKRTSVKKVNNEKGKYLFKKIEKIIHKNGQITVTNKLKSKLIDDSNNKSYIKYQKNINDKIFSSKCHNLTQFNVNTKNPKIDYTSNNKRDISVDKSDGKQKLNISNIPNSTRYHNLNISLPKNINMNKKKMYYGIPNSYAKMKNKKIPSILSSVPKTKPEIHYKRLIISEVNEYDSHSFQISHPHSIKKINNESSIRKNNSKNNNNKCISELNSFDAGKSEDKTYAKINILKKEHSRKNSYTKDLFFNSIKVNKNMKIYKKLSTDASKNIIEFHKLNQHRPRLLSCKFTDEQISKLKKEIIAENNNFQNFKKISSNIHKFRDRPASTKVRKSMQYFENYINCKNIKKNESKEYSTNNNISENEINNNSIMIKNSNSNSNNIDISKELKSDNNKYKKKKFTSKNSPIKDSYFINKIKMKIISKPMTTCPSQDNSKINNVKEEIHNYNNTTSKKIYNNTKIKNKIIHNTKKIFINNIINFNGNNDSNLSNIINSNNNNPYSYRGNEKDNLQKYKNQIMNSTPCLEYSFIQNIGEKAMNNNAIKNILPLSENSSNKNEGETKDSGNTNKCPKKNVVNNKPQKNVSKSENEEKSESLKFNLFSSSKKNLGNIFDNINRNTTSHNKDIVQNNTITSTLQECTYYKKEAEKLSSYIREYFKNNNEYPKANLNFYKYGRLLGKGAFGKVNLALHLASGRLVAVKSFNKKKISTRRAKRKIKTEIEALSKLRNPFCTQIYDYFETNTHILIVMEYICGDLLGFMKKRGKLSEPTAKIIFKQIIKGLQFIHKKRIVHRDIKLDNILIDLTNTVKICDFGVSRILQPKDIMYEHCGTPAYIAPEIFKDEGYEGFSCDVWSAGVTLYYMLAGMQPFKADKIEELKEIIIKGEFEPIENLSNEASDLINKMLEVDPEKRITVDEILKHPWLKNVNIKNRKKIKIFTNAEKSLLSKYDVNYLSSPKEELIENFTVKNLETKEEKDERGGTKSEILAPYNSYILKHDSNDLTDEIKIENDICKFNFKAQISNIKYELSNNQEFDNGIIKTMYNSFEEMGKKTSHIFEPQNSNTLNLSFDTMDTFSCGISDDIIKDIEELIGYDRKYLVQCLRNNDINYATATYYLMLKDELN
jgi:serine/threonine protein kinase